MKNIIVRECFESIPIGTGYGDEGLTPDEAHELFQYIRSNEIDQASFLWKPDSLTVINYVGYIQLTGCSIEILPKISSASEDKAREVLLNLLTVSGYLDVDYSTLSSLKETRKNLFEIFGYLFAIKLKNEIVKGLHASYVATEENLPYIKGKLIIKEQIKNFLENNGRAFCRYEEFSADTRLNRILKFAIRLLITKVRNIKTLELLKYCLMHFEGVSEWYPLAGDLNNIFFDRTNQRYQQAYILAKMFLANYCSLTSAGRTKSFSILFEMNMLFERYISKLALRHIEGPVHIQHSKYKLLVNENTGKGVFLLKPDIVIGIEESEQLIIDTKWKMINNGVSREDYYQMYAYLTRYPSAKAVILLYPHNPEYGSNTASLLQAYHLEENPQKRLRVYTIDWENVLNTIRDLQSIVTENLV